jgi:hypothetical protein
VVTEAGDVRLDLAKATAHGVELFRLEEARADVVLSERRDRRHRWQDTLANRQMVGPPERSQISVDRRGCRAGLQPEVCVAGHVSSCDRDRNPARKVPHQVSAGKVDSINAAPAVRPVLDHQAIEDHVDGHTPRIREHWEALITLSELLAKHRRSHLTVA